MRYFAIIILFSTLFSCTTSEKNSISVIEDSSYFYNDTVYDYTTGETVIYLSPYQEEKELEMPYAHLLLHVFSYYRDHIPGNYVKFDSPETMYYSIPDTLKRRHYTYYIPKSYVQSYLGGFEMDISKFFGIITSSFSDTIFISTIYPNSAADSAGLKTGDKIIAIDKFPLYGDMNVYSAVVNDNNKEYNFVICRSDSLLDTIPISKQIMTTPASYSDSLTPNVGYVKLKSFIADSNTVGGSTSHQFHEALKRTSNFPVTIVDLRGNGGGYISEAYYTSSFFLAKQSPMITIESWVVDENSRDYSGSMESEIKYTEVDGEFKDKKYVFLVDGGSASASEILISAIKHNTNHPIVGTQTYGKGIGQTSLKALNGAMAHITKLLISTPDGTKYHQIGFTPDYIVEYSVDNFMDTQLNKAIEVANSLLSDGLTKMLSNTTYKYDEFDNSEKNYIDFPGLGFHDVSDEYIKER